MSFDGGNSDTGREAAPPCNAALIISLMSSKMSNTKPTDLVIFAYETAPRTHYTPPPGQSIGGLSTNPYRPPKTV